MQAIHSPTGARWVAHCSGDDEQQFRRNQSVRIKEDQNLVSGEIHSGIPNPGDIVL